MTEKKIKSEPVNQEKSQTKPKEGPGDCSPKASENGGVIQKEVPHQGKLILDAKMFERATRYPTDCRAVFRGCKKMDNRLCVLIQQ